MLLAGPVAVSFLKCNQFINSIIAKGLRFAAVIREGIGKRSFAVDLYLNID